MERQILTIMNYVDGVNDTPFHDPDNPIVITEYTFTSKRMGNVSLTATLMHGICLDDEWDGTQYVTFNGEKYFISATPSSSKSSDDARYRHELTFMAERDIKLNNIYFYDAVSEESTGDDKYKSNSTKVVFFGDIHEFVARLNESLAYSNVGYTAVVDDGITSEAKLMSFEDQFFFNVLQEIFNVYELPFYFVGTVIHIGFTANAITHPFRYGFDNELLSIEKNNANYKIVTRCTGTGSSDNIPYYYPNSSPRGMIAAKAGDSNAGILQDDITIKDYQKFYDGMGLNDILGYNLAEWSEVTVYDIRNRQNYASGADIKVDMTNFESTNRSFEVTFNVTKTGVAAIRLDFDWAYASDNNWHTWKLDDGMFNIYQTASHVDDVDFTGWIDMSVGARGEKQLNNIPSGTTIYVEFKKTGECVFDFAVFMKRSGRNPSATAPVKATYNISVDYSFTAQSRWLMNGSKETNPSDIGLSFEGSPQNGDTIMQIVTKKITPSDKLLPPIYRESDGAERFYNAVNDTYTNPDTGGKYVFENEFVANAPKEHIVEFEDIKPTIKGAENAAGQRMDQILAVAFDDDDNDEVDEEGNYLHPHFFVKLAKFDGEWGFNLFDQAIEDEEMTLAMTSGDCGACEFTIKVGEETQKNIVQVDSSGNLMRDDDGNVITSGTPQDRQNDTRNYEVWLALEKDESTYGQIMPNALQNIRPKAGDSFVLLNIKMPDEYVYRAENELKEAIIKYMAENNAEKFNFSIDFSRIYLAQNKDIASQLNENARIQLEYNGKLAEFYISQYTYKCVDGEALPEVTVELTDTVTVSKTTLQNSIDAVQQDIQNGIGSIDFLKQGLRYFLRKDVDDESRGTPRFLSGAEFGRFSSGTLGAGAAVRIDSNNASHMEVDYLSVRRRADFTTISVQELKQIGGQLIISPAAMVCSSVEETDTAYRCYFDSGKDSGSPSIYNQFEVNDQARMQVFNQWGGRYFWRLVTAVGDDWIELSKTDCEEGSDIPQAGDNIVQLGNRSDTTRQSAQIFSCFGENAPSFIMYNGINSYDLTGKNITGIVYNPETGEPQMYSYGAMFFGDRDIEADDANYITFQQKSGDSKKKLYISADIKIGAGSSGLSNLEEWDSVQESITDAAQNAQEALDKAQEAKDYIDNTLPIEISEINARLDGVVENWFYKYTPTRENEPALTWIADGTEADHAGDTFTNIQEYVDDETTPDAGKSWRWALVDGQYTWTPIADSDAVKALQQASQAQDTADQKRRVFVTTPYPPYDIGDIWTQGPSGEIMRCITARASGNYAASDWDRASKYTDDAVAQSALSKAGAAQDAADAAQNAADAAQADATAAAGAAANAQKDATAANTQIDNLMSDNVITPPEKTALKQQHSDIKTEYSQIIADAQKYGVSTTAYTSAYNSANSALTKYTAASPENITVGSDYSNISAYYTARQTILNAIATAAKKAADDAQKAADDAQKAADDAQSTANSAAASASQAIKNAAEAQNLIQQVRGNLNDLSDQVTDLDEYLDGAFRDGVINDAESISIKKYINIVNESWTDLQSSYNVVYNNANLTETPKTNLKSAYDILSTRKSSLIGAINTAVSNPSETNVNAVDTAFTNYNSAVSTFKTALENASKSIEDAIRTTANEASQKVSDIEYLKDIFGKPTLDTEGAILAKLLAVKDENNHVVAGINASDEGMSSSGNRLLIFAGASDIQSIASADTRVYENGDFYTNRLYASNGKIGSWYIYKGWLRSETDSYMAQMTDDYLIYHMKTTTEYGGFLENTFSISHVTQFVIDPSPEGNHHYSLTLGISSTIDSYGGNTTYARIKAFTATVNASNARDAVGYYADVRGGKDDNFAFYAHKGMFGGLRPKTSFYTNGANNLEDNDFFVLTNTGAGRAMTLNLPSNPENGQTYFILKSAEGYIISINPRNKTIYRVGYGDMTLLNIGNEFAGLIIAVYSGDDDKWWISVHTRV